MSFAYHDHLFTVKAKSFPMWKRSFYLARGFYGEFQYRQEKFVTLLNLSLPNVAKGKFWPKFQISFIF